jgi:putative membrane protein
MINAVNFIRNKVKIQMEPKSKKERNYTPIIVILSIIVNVLVAILFFMPTVQSDTGFDLTILPLINAVLNSFTFVFLLAALIMILRKNINLHRRFIFAAFTSTALFLITYVTYHGLAESTHFGGVGPLKYFYFFILITHILLAIAIVPLALVTLARGLNMKVEKHRKIARWTMPIWLYVSLTGVLVYLLISPYY